MFRIQACCNTAYRRICSRRSYAAVMLLVIVLLLVHLVVLQRHCSHITQLNDEWLQQCTKQINAYYTLADALLTSPAAYRAGAAANAAARQKAATGKGETHRDIRDAEAVDEAAQPVGNTNTNSPRANLPE